ncbi:MAG: FtsX-like permease family protein, partial [Pseudomonadales bacterium]
LATKLGLQVGDKLRLMVMDNPGQMVMDGELTRPVAAGQRTAVHTVELVATLHTGSELDQRVALASLQTAAAISNNVAGFDGVQLQFQDVFAAPRLVAEIADSMPLLYRYSDWTRSYGNLYTAIQLSRQIVVLLLASIVAIAAFNIFVTLGMVVRHKRHDIAILRSMGYPKRRVLGVFIWQGMWVSAIGAACGLLLGCALAVLLPPLVNAQQAFAQNALLSTEIYPIDYLPSEIRAGDLLLISAVALAMSFVATLIPAWQAAKLQPASVLNGKGR